MSPAGKDGGKDQARLEIATPFGRAWLMDFLASPERLLRINPLIEISRLEKTGPRQWRMQGRNLANGRDFDVRFIHEPLPDGLRLTWDGWLKTFTEARIVDAKEGRAALVIIDDYSGAPEEERKNRIAEVDTSFTPWGQAIWRYLRNWKRWSWLPGYKFAAGRYWLRMKPSARRISFILIVLTAMEFALFLFVLLIFWLELPKYLD